MKFEDEDPSVVSETGSKDVDRSQGAARAISVSMIIDFPMKHGFTMLSPSLTPVFVGMT